MTSSADGVPHALPVWKNKRRAKSASANIGDIGSQRHLCYQGISGGNFYPAAIGWRVLQPRRQRLHDRQRLAAQLIVLRPCHTDVAKYRQVAARATLRANRPGDRQTEKYQSRETQRRMTHGKCECFAILDLAVRKIMIGTQYRSQQLRFRRPMRNQLQQLVRHCRAFRLALKRRAPARVKPPRQRHKRYRESARSPAVWRPPSPPWLAQSRQYAAPPSLHHQQHGWSIPLRAFARALHHWPRFERSLVRSIIGPRR
jgi:hypothetical protein